MWSGMAKITNLSTYPDGPIDISISCSPNGQDFGSFSGRELPIQANGQNFGPFSGRGLQIQANGQDFGPFSGRALQIQTNGQDFGQPIC